MVDSIPYIGYPTKNLNQQYLVWYNDECISNWAFYSAFVYRFQSRGKTAPVVYTVYTLKGTMETNNNRMLQIWDMEE